MIHAAPEIEPRAVANFNIDSPDGWSHIRLSHAITRIESGTSVNGEDRPVANGEIGVLKLSCVRRGVFEPQENKVVRQDDVLRASASVRGGTIIMSRKNTTELVGASAYSPIDIPNLHLSDLLWQIHVNPRVASPKWLAYLFAGQDARMRISALASGTSQSMKNISKERVLALTFGFPPICEQARAVSVLDSAGIAIRATENLIEAKLRYKSALAEQLLTGERRFSKFGEHAWQEARMGDHLAETSERFPENEIPIVLSCSKLYGILLQSERFSKRLASNDLQRYKSVEPGDLVFDPMLLWDASISFSRLRGVVSPAYCTLRFFSREVNQQFVSYLLFSASMRYAYKVISQGTNARRRKVTSYDFLKIKIILPPPAEQRRIAEVLGLLDEEIRLLRRQLDVQKLQKQGLMQELLTGRVRVKGHAT